MGSPSLCERAAALCLLTSQSQAVVTAFSWYTVSENNQRNRCWQDDEQWRFHPLPLFHSPRTKCRWMNGILSSGFIVLHCRHILYKCICVYSFLCNLWKRYLMQQCITIPYDGQVLDILCIYSCIFVYILCIYSCIFVVVQSLGCVWLFATPWTAACQAPLSFTVFQSLVKLMSIESVILSNHLILCCTFSFGLQSFPVSGSFPMSQLFSSGGQSIRASASVLPVNIQGWFPLGSTDLIFLLSKGHSRVYSSLYMKVSLLNRSQSVGSKCMNI